MPEKRGAPRYRCQLPCVARIGKERHDATVIDLSSTSLSIRTTLDVSQGDELELVIEPAIQFGAIAWRTTRTRSGFTVGLMLSNACTEYEGLVERHASRRPAATTAASPAQATEVPSAPAELWWRLRVKDGDGNRTRAVAIVAASREEAIERAFAEIGSGWEILEAELAPRAPIKKPVTEQNA